MAVALSNPSTLGEVIRTRRQLLGLTQEQLAERVGNSVSQSDISRIERGGVALPRRQRLEEIATALEISLADLLMRSNWMNGNGAGEDVPSASSAVHDSAAEPALIDPLLREELLQIEARLETMATEIASTQQAVRTVLRKLHGIAGSEARPDVGIWRRWETSTPVHA